MKWVNYENKAYFKNKLSVINYSQKMTVDMPAQEMDIFRIILLALR